MQSSTTMTSLNNINNKVSKLFNNPNINFFIIMNLVLLISCYTFINTPLKNTISSFIANPIIILFSLILIIMIGYHNINIAILSLLLLFIILFGSSLFTKQNINNKINNTKKNNNNNKNNNKNINNIEGFTDDTEELNKEEKIKKSEKKFAKKVKEDKTNSREDRINNFKDVLMGSLTKITKGAENEYKKGLLENKQIMYENEKHNNKNNDNGIDKKLNSKNKNKSNSNTNGKESFQTIKTREFDPSNEEDTNFLITKEVLQDMINRIEYNFESNEYLKQYLKHRIEEIVELNKLVDDYED
jgi:hypothetical protein